VILSHRHRFIFIKTRKTAGTSVEISLSRYCGATDVLTPIVPEDEAIRADLGCAPRNFERPAAPYRWRRAELGQLRHGRWPHRMIYWNHITAAEIKSRSPVEWESYLKFSIVRNPWDSFVSGYFWVQEATGQKMTVDEALKRFDIAQNWNSYTINDDIAMDFMCRYESLRVDLGAVTEKIGVPFDGWLPYAKANTGRNGASIREVLESRHIKIISERCAKEIDTFGYEEP
jgi:hypothetical protein